MGGGWILVNILMGLCSLSEVLLSHKLMGQDRTRWWGQKEVVVKKVVVLQKQVELQEVVEVII